MAPWLAAAISRHQRVVGSKVIYAQAAGEGLLDTDVVLDSGDGNTAAGHVKLDLATDSGVATFSGGTGKFAGFQASVDVSTDSNEVWHWDGTYSFGPGV